MSNLVDGLLLPRDKIDYKLNLSTSISKQHNESPSIFGVVLIFAANNHDDPVEKAKQYYANIIFDIIGHRELQVPLDP